MGKKEIESSLSEFRKIISDIKNNIYCPFYLIMGEEPYYSDVITEEITKRALEPHERDFNQVIVYGSDSSAAQVVESARRFPMMASRQVIIVKEAQQLSRIKDLEHYFSSPSATTILVVSLTNNSLDKRTSLYKNAKKNGCVFESFSLYPDMAVSWIENYLKERGYLIVPEAAVLLAEYIGTELRKLVQELNKILTNLPEEIKTIDLKIIEENTGISREYNVFELTKAISFKDSTKAFKIVRKFASAPRQYPLVVTLAALFSHFTRLLKYHAAVSGGRTSSRDMIASSIGIRPYFMPEYDYAVKHYSLIKCMEVVSLIRKYDSVSKSGARGEASDGDLLHELIYKIMH